MIVQLPSFHSMQLRSFLNSASSSAETSALRRLAAAERECMRSGGLARMFAPGPAGAASARLLAAAHCGCAGSAAAHLAAVFGADGLWPAVSHYVCERDVETLDKLLARAAPAPHRLDTFNALAARALQRRSAASLHMLTMHFLCESEDLLNGAEERLGELHVRPLEAHLDRIWAEEDTAARLAGASLAAMAALNEAARECVDALHSMLLPGGGSANAAGLTQAVLAQRADAAFVLAQLALPAPPTQEPKAAAAARRRRRRSSGSEAESASVEPVAVRRIE